MYVFLKVLLEMYIYIIQWLAEGCDGAGHGCDAQVCVS